MKLHRILALCLALCMLASLFVIPTAAEYSDVANSHWAKKAIERWSGYGIINGSDGKFYPDQNITRAEMAVILNNLMKYKTRSANTFTDLTDTWYTDAVLKVNAAGVMLGSDGKIRPTDPITREEAFSLFARALGIEPITGHQIEFKDRLEVSRWAYTTIYAMIRAGYIHGSGGYLRPKANLTRAEAVTVLDQIVALMITEPGEYTGDVNGFCIISSPKGASLKNMYVNGGIVICDSVADVKSVRMENVCYTGKLLCRDVSEDGENTEVAPDLSNEPDSGDSVVVDGKIVYGKDKLDILKGVPKNTLKDSYFKTDSKGVITYNAPGVKTVQGIDVSSWQGEIDWKKVAADGIEFAIIRVGFRGYTVGGISEDKYFKANIEGAIAAGLDVGVYFFSQAISEKEARQEAEFVLSRLKGYKLKYPVVFDWESVDDKNARTAKVTDATLNACAIAFCEQVKAAGYIPSVYFGTSKGLLDFQLDKLKNYDFWYARYKSDTPRFYYAFDIWQYTSTGRVNGIEGDVDRNICFKAY